MPHNHVHQSANAQKKQTIDYNRSFAIGVLLNVLFVIIEAGYGISAQSMALIADAGHNLSDVFSLLLAWGAAYLATKPATETKTYGLKKITIMASLASAITLLIALGGIAWEAFGRLFNPQPVAGVTIIVVAGIGVIVNALTAGLFFAGQKYDLNIKGAFLHMVADAGISFGVVVAGILILLTGWLIIDPLISLFIVAVVLVGTWSLLRDSFNLAIDAVPENIDIAGVRNYLVNIENVCGIHDLHVWPLSTTATALSVHLVMNDVPLEKDFLSKIQQKLHDRFNIEHSTIQLEKSEDNPCFLDIGMRP